MVILKELCHLINQPKIPKMKLLFFNCIFQFSAIDTFQYTIINQQKTKTMMFLQIKILIYEFELLVCKIMLINRHDLVNDAIMSYRDVLLRGDARNNVLSGCLVAWGCTQ